MPVNSEIGRTGRRGIGLYHVALVVLILLPIGVYSRVLDYGFVNYDDPEAAADNVRVTTGLNAANVKWAFADRHMANWIPLTWVSLMLDTTLYGPHPAGYHATNVLLHTLNTLLLFLVLKYVTGATWRSWFVAALFSVHPQHVESVAWITERKDVLCIFFGLLSIGSYTVFVRTSKARWYAASLVFFALSLASKQALITLPCVLLLLDVWPLRRTPLTDAPLSSPESHREPTMGQSGQSATAWRRLVLEKVPFFALTTVFCFITMFAQEGALQATDNFSLSTRAANAVVVYVVYLRRLVWPNDLAVFYPHPGDAISTLSIVGCALFLIVISVMAIRLARRFPYLIVGWLWYLGTMVPVIGLIQVSVQRMADRYAYFPMIGIYVAVCWAFADCLRSWCAAVKYAVTTALLALATLAAVAWVQVGHWKDSESLFTHALSVTQRNVIAHMNLGTTLYEQGRYSEAIREFTQAVQIRPQLAEGHHSLGVVLRNVGQLQSAAASLQRAIDLAPHHERAHMQLGLVLQTQGRFAEAEVHHRRALEIRPTFTLALNNLGNSLAAQGRIAESEDAYKSALDLDPDLHEARFNLAMLRMNQGRFEEAVVEFERLAAARPESDDVREHLVRARRQAGGAAGAAGRVDDAIKHFQRAIVLRPYSPSLHYLLARSLALKGAFTPAAEHLLQALRIRPDFAEAHNDLGLLLLRQNRRAQAVEHFAQALKIRPGFKEAAENLRRASGK